MSKFKVLTKIQTKELDDLIDVANSILNSSVATIKGNPKAAAIVGTAIGGATGAAIVATAGSVGVAPVIVSGAFTLAKGAAFGIAGVGTLPITILTILGGGIGLLMGKKREKKKQANYVKQFAEKMEEILNKYEELKKEHERTNKEKDDIIRAQKEKLAEYEAIFEALKKKRAELEENLSLA